MNSFVSLLFILSSSLIATLNGLSSELGEQLGFGEDGLVQSINEAELTAQKVEVRSDDHLATNASDEPISLNHMQL